ncbi:MAG: acyltransferase [Candidatus Caenarcaniphilales bacterium]|nr:acyltransferase [Candidatus Caenarcaniphilales bacterium]
MFGIYRFLLALLVSFNHLTGQRGIGSFAVFGFFILSGYLMTLILNQKYGFTRSGILKFILNRFLRIYPTYWLVLLLSVGAIYALGHATDFHPNMRVVKTSEDFISNIAIFGLAPFGLITDNVRLVPPTWALDVELTFYIFIALWLGRSPKRSLIGLILGFAFASFYLIAHRPELAYCFWLSALLPFSIGCCVYHYRDRLEWFWSKIGFLNQTQTSWVVFLVVMMFGTFLVSGLSLQLGRYLFCLPAGLMVFLLSKFNKNSFSPVLVGIDNFLGDLSYPLYLTHYLGGYLTWYFLKPCGGEKHCLLNFFFGTGIALLISTVLVFALERSIKKVRECVLLYGDTERLPEGEIVKA